MPRRTILLDAELAGLLALPDTDSDADLVIIAQHRGLAIVLWNTMYLERAVRAPRRHDHKLHETLCKHLSPLDWEHINLAGDYVWKQNRVVEPGKHHPLRPLRMS